MHAPQWAFCPIWSRKRTLSRARRCACVYVSMWLRGHRNVSRGASNDGMVLSDRACWLILCKPTQRWAGTKAVGLLVCLRARVGIVARMSIVSGSVKRVLSVWCVLRTTGTHHLYCERTGNGLGLSWFRRALQISGNRGWAPRPQRGSCGAVPAHQHHRARGGRVHAQAHGCSTIYCGTVS